MLSVLRRLVSFRCDFTERFGLLARIFSRVSCLLCERPEILCRTPQVLELRTHLFADSAQLLCLLTFKLGQFALFLGVLACDFLVVVS